MPTLASEVVWFDAFTSNVDRTARNTNLLMWHRRLWLIDHGASLYFHHGTPAAEFAARADDPFPRISEHVLLGRASAIGEADARLAPRLTDEVIDGRDGAHSRRLAGRRSARGAQRAAYADYLRARVRGPRSIRGGGDPCATVTRMTTPCSGSCRTSSARSSSTSA